ncbi:copper resistance CopC family protein [Microbacterium sp.]|uniref:copper resistance CopC family protein n=1 Tax=Microbacterium sp. TaxID=51671 RepID=UPI0039E2E44C
MKTAARSIPLAPLALAAALLAAFLVIVSAQPASAHDQLTGSSPAADSTVEVLPGEIALTFSNDLITGEGATLMTVTDAAGVSVTDGPALTEGATVRQPLVAEAEAGLYQVVWKVVSSDGHPTEGSFSFTVTRSTATAPTAAPVQTPVPQDTSTATAAPTTSTPEASTPADASEGPFGFWLIGGVVLALLALLVLVLSRRGNRSAPGTDGPSAR